MDPQIAQHTYEQIDNYILRLLLYFGGAVIVALSSALTYLWATWRSDQRERIQLDTVNAAAMNAVANELDNVRERLKEVHQLLEQIHDHERKSQPRPKT